MTRRDRTACRAGTVGSSVRRSAGCSGEDGKDGAQWAAGAQGPRGHWRSRRVRRGRTGPSGEAGPPGPTGPPATVVIRRAASPRAVSARATASPGSSSSGRRARTTPTYISNLGGEEVATWTGPTACGNCHAIDGIEQRVAGNVNFAGTTGPANVDQGPAQLPEQRQQQESPSRRTPGTPPSPSSIARPATTSAPPTIRT